MAGYALSTTTPAARLFEEYGEQLYRFCLGRMRSREEAEDAVQSTFLRAHKALERGVVPEYEAAWLYKIAHNVCMTRRSVLARTGQTIPLHGREDVEVAIAAPETRHDELWGLPDALASLSPKLRQAILLREWQGLSYAEIADAMGTTVSAVETLIFRARRELAAKLEPERRRPKLVDLLAALFGPKLAAGAALLVLGGAGVGTAFELQRHGATTPPPRPVPTLASTPIGAAIAVPQRTPRAAHPAARVAPATPRPVQHVVTTAALPPAPALVPTATPAAPVVPPVAATPPAETPSPTTTVAAATTAVVTPTVAAPTVEAPSVSLPAVTVPSVELPTIPTPTVTVPAPPLDLGH